MKNKVDESKLAQRLYGYSPFVLGSAGDNRFRDHIDTQLKADVVIEVRQGAVDSVHGLSDTETYSVIDWDDINSGDV